MAAVKITELNPLSVKSLDKVASPMREGFVISTEKSSAVLNGTVDGAVNTLQDILNEIREEKGTASGHYRLLVSVRNKLESEKDSAKEGKSSTVHLIPNGVNITREAPPVLAGIPLVAEGEVQAARRGRGRPRKTVESKPADVPTTRRGRPKTVVTGAPTTPPEYVITETVIIEPPTRQPVVDEKVRDNWEMMKRHAPNDRAAAFWGRKLKELSNA